MSVSMLVRSAGERKLTDPFQQTLLKHTNWASIEGREGFLKHYENSISFFAKKNSLNYWCLYFYLKTFLTNPIKLRSEAALRVSEIMVETAFKQKNTGSNCMCIIMNNLLFYFLT